MEAIPVSVYLYPTHLAASAPTLSANKLRGMLGNILSECMLSDLDVLDTRPQLSGMVDHSSWTNQKAVEWEVTNEQTGQDSQCRSQVRDLTARNSVKDTTIAGQFQAENYSLRADRLYK